MSDSHGKWFVVDKSKKEVRGTRAASKEEATRLLSTNLNMIHGGNKPWEYWQKQGYKVRKS